jgi:hypothetical protein
MQEYEKKDFGAFLILGGIMGLVGVFGGLADIGLSAALGGADISTLPKDAIGRFAISHRSALEGLYKLDLLNVCISLATLPFFLAIALAHRERRPAFALLAFAIAAIGTAVFAAGNSALPMLDLSVKYYASTDDIRRQALAAAGEALLATGAHGSRGAFPGFALSSLASLLFSLVMSGGRVFSRTAAILGIAGSSILILYLIAVTFMPGLEPLAMLIAMAGGLATMGWLVLASIRLIGLGRTHEKA